MGGNDIEHIIYAKKSIARKKLEKNPGSAKLKREYRSLDAGVKKFEAERKRHGASKKETLRNGSGK